MTDDRAPAFRNKQGNFTETSLMTPAESTFASRNWEEVGKRTGEKEKVIGAGNENSTFFVIIICKHERHDNEAW